MKTSQQVIDATITLFEKNPNSWTTYAMARDKHFSACSPEQPKATSWCLLGALTRITHLNPTPVYIWEEVLHRCKAKLTMPLHNYNDSVLKSKEEAINFLKSI